MKCSLEATFIQQMKGDKLVYLPVIFRKDDEFAEVNDDPKIIYISGARQYSSREAAEKFATKALRKLWRTLMKSAK